MSKYTTEVRFICEQAAGLVNSAGYNSIDSVLDSARNKVFDFDFPIFDENYRVTLENKILKHYYTREICCETVGLWKHFLCTRMNEIMPYYNQLYKSALIEFNPLYDIDITTERTKEDNGNNERNKAINENETFDETKLRNNAGNTNEQIDTTVNEINNKATNQEKNSNNYSKTENESANKNDRWEYFSDTPEGGINGVEDLNYLTNATHITDDGDGTTSSSEVTGNDNGVTVTAENGTTDGTSNRNRISNFIDNSDDTTSNNRNKGINESNSETIKNIEDYFEHVYGKRGGVTYSKMLEEYRKTFLNIDLMVIKELKDLFMNIW